MSRTLKRKTDCSMNVQCQPPPSSSIEGYWWVESKNANISWHQPSVKIAKSFQVWRINQLTSVQWTEQACISRTIDNYLFRIARRGDATLFAASNCLFAKHFQPHFLIFPVNYCHTWTLFKCDKVIPFRMTSSESNMNRLENLCAEH